MTDTSVLEIGLQALLLAGKLAGPFLLVVLALGTLVGLAQSVTQIQEQTISFVPKFLASGVVLLVAGNWMLAQSIAFTHHLFDMIPSLLSSS
jgi:flagellar biosynthetic protein FliQ